MAIGRKNSRSRGKTKKTSAKKSARRKNSRRKSKGLNFESEIVLWILLAVSILLFVSNFGFGGKIGNTASAFLFGLFGVMAYLFPIVLFVGSCFLISNKKNHFAIFKFIAAILLFCAICMFSQLLIQDSNMTSSAMIQAAYLNSYNHKTGGGALGGFFVWLCVPNFGIFGSYVIDIIVMIISLVLITERSALLGMKRGGRKIYESAREDARRIHDKQQKREEERALKRMDKKVSGVALDTALSQKEDPFGDEVSEIRPEPEEILPKAKKREHIPVSSIPKEPVEEMRNSSQEIPLPEIYIEPSEEEKEPSAEEYEDAAMLEGILSDVKNMKEPEIYEEPQKPDKADEMSAQTVQKPESQKASANDMPAAVDNNIATIAKDPIEYRFPPISLLKQGSSKAMGDSKSHLQATAIKLQQTLKNFGVNVTILNVSSGPSVTRYEIQPEMGVKVSKIVNLTDDIKLNLAAADIRMEAPIPGKAAIGIEIPNKETVAVAFRDLIESEEFQKNTSKIAFAAGKDIAGKVIVTDIAKMPHLLIAGATGSGKSVCINTIIMSILYKAHPDDVKLIMVDPKVVELSVYNGIPHLMIPVVTDPKKAAGALNWAVAEMDDRYKKFAEYGVRDLKGYNAKVESVAGIEEENKPQKLPQIVIIVDELADLMMVASHEVETAICRLAQLARAAGLHLIIATQRPSVNVITGLIKANMPSRIAFSVTSGVDSRTILDMVGAEKLLGKGDMLFFPQNFQKPLRVQGAFVSDKEVSDVVDFLKNENGVVEYNTKVQEKMEQSENISVGISDGAGKGDDRDVLFQDAGRFLIESEKGSIGSIQRKFKVGFNRAARIMDQLEEAGLVGPEEGTKPRKVLMSPEEFEQYLEECV